MAMSVRLKEALPEFVRRTVWTGLVTPTVSEGKLRVVGERVTEPIEEATPVPVTVI